MATDMDFEFGFDAQGIENLLNEVKGLVILKAGKDAVDQLTLIKNACNANWVGQSKEDFFKQLDLDAASYASALQELYTAFETEIANAGFNFDNFDRNLFR